MSTQKDLTIIGNNVLATVANIAHIPAKVDTGADSSSVWASHISIDNSGQLTFALLGPSHPLYTGELITTRDYIAKQVRNSTGDVSIRYQVVLPVKIKDRKIRARFTLADRSKNRFPVLIGRKTLQNKFLVDVSKIAVSRPATFDNTGLNHELAADPQQFHQKYMQKL